MRTGLVLLSLFLSSCSWISMPSLPDISLTPHKIDISQGNLVTPEMRERLNIGMTRAQVRTALGTPLVSDPFHADRWDYIYRFERKATLQEAQRLTLYFEGDRLVRIDDSAMPDAATATPGKIELGR